MKKTSADRRHGSGTVGCTGQPILRHRLVNSWRLFGLVVLPMSAAVLLCITQINTQNPAAVSGMIAFSVRLAVPFLYLAFIASALPVLFPGQISSWVLRNRRIFGLCFAAGMAWQLLFIVWLISGFPRYYMDTAYNIYDLAEQIPGYAILIAMTLTSFSFGRRWLTAKQWRMLHKGGIYFLWGVVWSTYWFELYYYSDIQTIDYIYYWLGFGAWLLRIAAWARKRRRHPAPIVQA